MRQSIINMQKIWTLFVNEKLQRKSNVPKKGILIGTTFKQYSPFKLLYD